MAIPCFFTNDVEHTSVNGGTYDRIANVVETEALPRLLDLYDKYNVKATFFVLASLAEIRPNIVKQIYAHGQEVASHGYSHDYKRAFDVLSLEQQVEELRLSKDILEQITGEKVVSFRAPALRVNQYTPTALQETGFQFDSSIAPQRLDAFMSLGGKEKKQWLRAPRHIYRTAVNNLAREGSSSIIEVPVSSFGIPYIGTVMRISPYVLNTITRDLLYFEAKQKQIPINFLFHPSESVKETTEEYAPKRRASSVIGHFFSDVVRAKLKQRHLDESALTLLEQELCFWSQRECVFMQVKQAIL